MNELHKPLGQRPGSSAKTNSNRWVMIGLGGLAVALLSLTAYIFIDARQENTAVVALNDAKVEPEKKPEPPVQQSEDENTADSQRLSPSDPLPEEIAPEPQSKPSFKPRPVEKKRLSNWVPLPELVEKSEFGPLPKISSSGLRPLDAYSQSSGRVGANRVAIVVGGLGLSQSGSKDAIAALPSSITLGFSPFGNSLGRWVQRARQEGHEVVLQLPMEPLGYPSVNPGPHTLNSKASEGANLGNLRWSLGRMTNYPVVMNYLGAGVAGKHQIMRPLLEEIRNRGLGYVDDGTVQVSAAPQLSKEMRLPNAVANMVVDASRDSTSIRAQLKGLELLAKKRGFAIATATGFPESVEQISKWAKEAPKNGIQIVPLSNLIRDYGN